jgi:ATP-binding cassette subfamily F protein 3
VALARLVALGVNVLILDEPTNHLDLWACDSLEQGLQGFEGTVVVVSHDRYFLNRVVDLLIALDGTGGAQVIHGNYDTYELMRAQQEADGKAKKEKAAKAGAAAKPAREPPSAKVKWTCAEPEKRT